MADASSAASVRLLGLGDPPPFTVYRADGASPFLLLADHAGQRVPQALGDLGLAQAELDRHIGWDIGIDGTTRMLAGLLDAFAITQTYSRLVIDCNRPLTSATSIAAASDGTAVPGNLGLDEAARHARACEIFAPYHARIATELDARGAAGRPAILIAMHSFTPRMNGFQRPWQAGVLYNRDGRLAHALREALQAEGLVVGDNQPYAVSDASDYAVPVHAEARGLPYVELEIRQDLIADEAGQRDWARRLARLFEPLGRAFTSA